MQSNDVSAHELNESTELDELMAQVWKRAMQEAPQDQAQRGDAQPLTTGTLTNGEPERLSAFAAPTAVAGPDPLMPLVEAESAYRYPAPCFSTSSRSPLATQEAAQKPHSATMYSPFSQMSPLTIATGEVSLPLTGTYTQSHVLMTPNGANAVPVLGMGGGGGSGGGNGMSSVNLAGVEEEMVILQQQQQQKARQHSPLYTAASCSPFEGSGSMRQGWPATASHSTPIGQQPQPHQPPHQYYPPPPQQQQQQLPLSPPVSWAAAHPRTPLAGSGSGHPATSRCMTPPQAHGFVPVSMPSIAAAVSGNATAKDPSPSQRRLPSGTVMSPGAALAAVRPQPRQQQVTPPTSCATPLYGNPSSMPLYKTPGYVGSGTRTSSPPFQQPMPFFTTPSTTPSRLSMARNMSFTTSPVLAAEFQSGGRQQQQQQQHLLAAASTPGVFTTLSQPSARPGASPGRPTVRGTSLLSTPPSAAQMRHSHHHLGNNNNSSTTGEQLPMPGVPQVYVSASKTRADTPPTPSVAPLLALLRGNAAGTASLYDTTTIAAAAPDTAPTAALPASPSQRPQSGAMGSPARDGSATTAAMLLVTGAATAGNGVHTLPLRERVLRLSQDQVGCRMLQAIVDAEMTGPEPPAVLFTTSVAIQQLLEVLMPDVATVMSDSYGNFLIQKLFDVAPPEARKRLLRDSTLSTQLAAVACSCHGTFAVQRLIETMSDEEEEELVKAALRRSTLQLLTDVNGGHVIGKWLGYMRHRYGGLLSTLAATTATTTSPLTTRRSDVAAVASQLHGKTDFLFDGILANLMTVCLNRQGCCIVQKTCDYWNSMSLPAPLSLPDSADAETAESASLRSASWQRTPVRVVQDAVVASDTSNSLQRFVVALLDHVRELAVDPFGNYVLTHAVKLCYVKGYLKLVDAIAGCLLQPEANSPGESAQQVVRLCRNKFASNVVEQVLRLCGEKRVRAVCRLLLYTPAPSAAPASVTAPRPFLEPIAWNRAHVDPSAEVGAKGPTHEAPPLLAIALDSYGNYVVQTLLTVAPVSELVGAHMESTGGGILPVLQEALPRLRDKNFGRKMETKLGLAQLRVSQSTS